MRILAIATLLLVSTSADAATKRAPFKPMTQDEMNTAVEMGQELEAYAYGDLNGDNDVDTVFIITSPDARDLYVALASRKNVPLRHLPGGSFNLQLYPKSPAQLAIHNGVLTVDDEQTGMKSIYRFRNDKAKGKLRLIGLEASRYPDGSEDGRSMSWNLVTGDAETALLRKTGSGYDTLYKTKKKRPNPPIYMPETPDPELELVSMTMAK